MKAGKSTAASGPAGDTPLLEVSKLHVQFGHVDAVRDVSLTVGRSEVVTLLGPNGAGKTTTLRAICGQVRPSGGDIQINGRRTVTLGAARIARLGVGLVPEGRRIFPGHTVLENLALGGYIWRRRRKVFDETMASVMELFPRLAERRAQLAGSLSGGEAQMLAIGRALMLRPGLLMLDEPSLGLAPMLVEEIFGVIREINREGMGILLVEQNANQALAIADYGYVLEGGRFVLEGSAEELRANENVQEFYLGVRASGDEPRLHVRRRRRRWN